MPDEIEDEAVDGEVEDPDPEEEVSVVESGADDEVVDDGVAAGMGVLLLLGVVCTGLVELVGWACVVVVGFVVEEWGAVVL